MILDDGLLYGPPGTLNTHVLFFSAPFCSECTRHMDTEKNDRKVTDAECGKTAGAGCALWPGRASPSIFRLIDLLVSSHNIPALTVAMSRPIQEHR